MQHISIRCQYQLCIFLQGSTFKGKKSARDLNNKEVLLYDQSFKVPKFKNEDEERKFWAKLDLSQYFNAADFERVSFPNLKPTSRSISIRLPEYLLNHLKEKANEINIPYQSLIKQYIKKGIFSRGA